MFCNPLNDYRRMVLSAFFYGNGVSEYRTTELIKACAPYFSVTDGSAIQNWFTKWNKSHKARSSKRYNLILNEEIWTEVKLKPFCEQGFLFHCNGRKVLRD